MENLNKALFLLVVGLLTVFVILMLVVAVGNLIIMFTNRFLPPPDDAEKGKYIDPKKLAVIVAAVDIVTKGKGKIANIEKIETQNK